MALEGGEWKNEPVIHYRLQLSPFPAALSCPSFSQWEGDGAEVSNEGAFKLFIECITCSLSFT